MTFQQRLEAIRSNRTTGAAELARQAAEALLIVAQARRPELEEAAREIVRAQPSMAPLWTLADAVLRSGDPAAACREFLARLRTSAEAVASYAARLVPSSATVLTHSHSSAVFDTLKQARPRRVICTESRPGREGVTLAERLGGEGIAATLIADAAIYTFLGEAQVALVGADSVSAAGLVNKCGTALLALAARARGVPLYALCGSEKFLPAGFVPPEEPKDPREILERGLPNVRPINYFFDRTPLEYLSGVVTGEGLLDESAVRARLEALPPNLLAFCK